MCDGVIYTANTANTNLLPKFSAGLLAEQVSLWSRELGTGLPVPRSRTDRSQCDVHDALTGRTAAGTGDRTRHGAGRRNSGSRAVTSGGIAGEGVGARAGIEPLR